MQIIKKVIIILFPILLLFIASVIFIYAGLHTESVRDGITLECAQRIVDHGSDYYIVTESGEMGIEFQISYGSDKGIDVALTGEDPLMYLNHAFFQSKHNSFLIKGKVYNEQYKGNTYYESYPEILSIEVESWEIITPIGRDYTYEKHGRLIYPTNYLDKYDVEHGDYVPEDKGVFCMIKNWEVYKKQERDAAFFDGYKYEDEGCSIMKPADSVLMHSSDTEFAGTTAPQSRVSFFIYFACLP